MADFKFYPAPDGAQYARFSSVKDILDKPALIPWAALGSRSVYFAVSGMWDVKGD